MGKPNECVRAMLDERGIEYRHQDGTHCSTTTWQSMFGEVMFAEREGLPSTLVLPQFIEGVTPEQAIAATLREYTYEQWRAISEIVGNAMEYAHDVAIRHPDKADPCWDLSNYVDQILEVAFGEHEAKLDAATAGGEADVRDD